MHISACFWEPFVSERVNGFQKRRKVLLSYFLIIASQVTLEKNFFLSDMKFYDCLLTRWLPTTSILVVIERIYCYKIKYNYLNNQKVFLFLFFFSCCYCIFGIYVKLHCFEKKMSLIGQVLLKLLTPKEVLI